MTSTTESTPITPKDIFEVEMATGFPNEADYLMQLGNLLTDLSTHIDFNNIDISVRPYYALDWYIDDLAPSVTFHVTGKEELAHLRTLLGGGAKCFDGRTPQYAEPQIAGVHDHYGIVWAVKRKDLQCTYEPTGEYEEVEETVTVQEAVTETRVTQREVMKKNCPPLLGD